MPRARVVGARRGLRPCPAVAVPVGARPAEPLADELCVIAILFIPVFTLPTAMRWQNRPTFEQVSAFG